jgi:hypothetical protein
LADDDAMVERGHRHTGEKMKQQKPQSGSRRCRTWTGLAAAHALGEALAAASQRRTSETIGKSLRVLRLTKAEHHEVAVSAAQVGDERRRRRRTGSAKYTPRFMRPRTFSAGSAMRCDHFALEVTAGDFAIAARRRRIAIS